MSQEFRPSGKLVFRAGVTAFGDIQRNGYCAGRIGTIAGASGGAKWLVLSQLDRVVARCVLPNLVAPVFTIGSSIGGWRFACYGQRDPVAAIDRFEQSYLEQTYSDKPDRQEISDKSLEILRYVLGDNGIDECLQHPQLRMNIMTVRAKHVTAIESKPLLAAGLIAAATANAVYRPALGYFFERVLFHDERDQPPFFNLPDFPVRHVALERQNFCDAILATGSIPLVLNGVRNIHGAPPGMYRDGGVIDYHLDFPHAEENRIALYLHFYPGLTPGWFDKHLSYRRAAVESTERTLLISPSAEFVASLPNGKIPDRRDFYKYSPQERVQAWRATVAACQELADELEDVFVNNRLAERVRPLTPGDPI